MIKLPKFRPYGPSLYCSSVIYGSACLYRPDRGLELGREVSDGSLGRGQRSPEQRSEARSLLGLFM